MTEIKGWHVFGGFALAFGIIIAVNLTLAYKAVSTFPGLEVRNSYVASQSFDKDRAAQLALGWEVSAYIKDNELVLNIARDQQPLSPKIDSAILGRATHVGQDQFPEFTFDGQSLRAPVNAASGNWNLRLRARGENGALFQQRIIVKMSK